MKKELPKPVVAKKAKVAPVAKKPIVKKEEVKEPEIEEKVEIKTDA